ncbi:hypothetical protein BO86DRAFT_177734 [Aspergillus japonicus CBS 114.51]|uniref:Uncharacterized protein n=1 Tax=Aspergillus japonicus CBS 114.51 TaxID=1448312 RepID=A0A8T8WRR5_ASPJA|nr:hypothetical protein BO86DRAFT_177734 [Aspergillus japonicus CBS 114.51]RAH78545.1 hypothetical protein BO86DRAFT_177734 [Aspergillus japonicus CBS 114.51]
MKFRGREVWGKTVLRYGGRGGKRERGGGGGGGEEEEVEGKNSRRRQDGIEALNGQLESARVVQHLAVLVIILESRPRDRAVVHTVEPAGRRKRSAGVGWLNRNWPNSVWWVAAPPQNSEMVGLDLKTR